MKIVQLSIVIVMAFFFIKDGFINPIKWKKEGKVPPAYQLGLVLIEIAFLSFFLVMFTRAK